MVVPSVCWVMKTTTSTTPRRGVLVVVTRFGSLRVAQGKDVRDTATYISYE